MTKIEDKEINEKILRLSEYMGVSETDIVKRAVKQFLSRYSEYTEVRPVKAKLLPSEFDIMLAENEGEDIPPERDCLAFGKIDVLGMPFRNIILEGAFMRVPDSLIRMS